VLHDLRFPVPAARAGLLWLPALGVPAAKYQPLAQALNASGLDVRVHEWRGTGGNPVRPSRAQDWGYAELLHEDLLPTVQRLRAEAPGRPVLVGGHSLGGQFAALTAAFAEGHVQGVALVATGVPHWRLFPQPFALGVASFALALPVLTRLLGHYPGQTLGFAGREAAGLMRDWARTVRAGHYDAPRGLRGEAERRLAALSVPVLGLRPVHDHLSPPPSLQALLDKCGHGSKQQEALSSEVLGTTADHFRWMRSPAAVAERIAHWAAREGLLSS
jgi:predicted alpha/beta hydrolase